ncbi:MAG: Ig-like domain-containing protein [Dermatophilaceae bacterium]
MRLLRGSALVVALAFMTSGCGSSDADVAAATSPPAAVSVSVPDGAGDVDPATAITVRATSGTLDEVTLTSTDGRRTVVGNRASDGVWTSAGVLLPKTTYVVTASARNAGGDRSVSKTSFATVTPDHVVSYLVVPDGHTVGAGMPVQVLFDSPITSLDVRAAIEAKLQISVTPAQEGAWGWVDNSSLMYRPRGYWASGTKITVSAPLAGTQVASGSYLMEDNGAKLTIGAQRVMKVDLLTHRMTLVEDGHPVKTFPISGGRLGERFETRGGTKVITEKLPSIIMDSSTFGIDKADPEYYRTDVQWAMRITDSGEFLHSAPWSVGSQGYANVSHGCINLSPGDASWLFQRAEIGDIVETTGSHYPLQPGEAGVSVWLSTWPQWQARSAVAAKTAASGTHA